MLSSEGLESNEDQQVIVSANRANENKSSNRKSNKDDSKRQGTFEDIVPIVDDAGQMNLMNDDNHSGDFMSFEPVDVANDDQAG